MTIDDLLSGVGSVERHRRVMMALISRHHINSCRSNQHEQKLKHQPTAALPLEKKIARRQEEMYWGNGYSQLVDSAQ